jgi:hypothetical protein
MADRQTVAELALAIIGDIGNAKKALEELEGKVDGLDSGLSTKSNSVNKSLTKIADGMTKTGKKLTLGLTVPLLAAGTASVKLASDLQETMGKVDVTFGQNADRVEEWAAASIDSMGLAKQTAMDARRSLGIWAPAWVLRRKQTMRWQRLWYSFPQTWPVLRTYPRNGYR